MCNEEKIREAYKNEWEKYHSEEVKKREQMLRTIGFEQYADAEKAYDELLKTKKQLENIGTDILGFSEKEIEDIKKECNVK